MAKGNWLSRAGMALEDDNTSVTCALSQAASGERIQERVLEAGLVPSPKVRSAKEAN